MSGEQKWPDRLMLVRHGESAGNLACDAAEAAGLPIIQIAGRDADVPLSALGECQAQALGRWFARQPPETQPQVILTSPYVRACQTAEIIIATAGFDRGALLYRVDERLREREFGILEGLTHIGIEKQFPEQAELRRVLGKFYHRPPGGESWCDVILRLRSALETLKTEHRQERILVVCHQVVVLCFRYLLEHMTEEQILGIGGEHPITNCSVTSYEYERTLGAQGGMALQMFNFVAPIADAGEEVTTRPDFPPAPLIP